jgi:hypothetical protein
MLAKVVNLKQEDFASKSIQSLVTTYKQICTIETTNISYLIGLA